MPLIGPDEHDKRKLHAEVNQLLNQRSTLATFSVTLFGVFTAWQVQTLASGGNASTRIWLGVLLQALLLVLFLLTHFKSAMLRTITTYLEVTKASGWEQDWRQFRNESHMGYAKPQAILFCLLVVVTAIIPITESVAAGNPNVDLGPILVLGSATAIVLLFVAGMAFGGWFGNELGVKRRWEELKNKR